MGSAADLPAPTLAPIATSRARKGERSRAGMDHAVRPRSAWRFHWRTVARRICHGLDPPGATA